MQDIAHTKHRAVIVAFIILIITIAALAVWPDARRQPNQVNKSADIIATVTYQCEEDKWVRAMYTKDNTVELELSDLRAITLPLTVSASGAKYANANENFVFWNNASTAFIQENNALTFTNCITE
ncbi:MAG: MliC family protein [Patescibacteria group bacterium]